MIEDFTNKVKEIIGEDIGYRVYSNVVPVNSSFPCFMFRRVFTDPYHTKDGADRGFTRIRCWVFDKYGVPGEKSAFQVAYDIVQKLKSQMNRLIVDGTEYRIEDERDEYEEETELYYTIFDVAIQHDY